MFEVSVKSFLKKSYLPIGLSILGMPLIETKLFKEISLREETPGVKTSEGIKTVRRNQWGWVLVPERYQTEVEADQGKAWRQMCSEADRACVGSSLRIMHFTEEMN